MPCSPPVPPFSKRWLAALILGGLGLGGNPGPASGQGPPAKAAPSAEAKAPGAIEVMPPWLKDAPFDAAKFFALPPKAENAAPLYIEAFAEIDGQVADWLPPDRRSLAEAGKARWKEWGPTIEAYAKDSASVPPKQADAALAAFADAIRKLDAAQARPKCVFATGLGVDTPIPHLQSARNFARLMIVQVHRSIDRDDFPAALKAVERTLRVSRDIRARGFAITQVVANSIDHMVIRLMIPPVLVSRKLKPEHCDRLLKLWADHEAQALDLFRTSLMGEYITNRVQIRLFIDGVETSAGPDGRAVDTKLDSPAIAHKLVEQALTYNRTNIEPKSLDDPVALKKADELLDHWRREAATTRTTLDGYTRALLAAPANFPARKAALEPFRETRLDRIETFENFMFANVKFDILNSARHAVDLGAAKCLVALRRWQLTSTKPPADLLAVCKAAKLPAVPADPFGTGPLQMTTMGDEPVIYSVGPDGVDDHAQVESDGWKKLTGDLISRLPKRK